MIDGLLHGGYDLLLCGGLLWVALQSVRSRNMFGAVVLFMVFGLVMAVVWARLGAPDLALAEAIIGAGIAGALLLNSCRAIRVDAGGRAASERREAATGVPRYVTAVFCALAGVGLAALMVHGMQVPGATAQVVAPAAHAHALGNPVTVVLLDLRAWDTLLELVVLLVAFLGARVLVDQVDLQVLHPPQAQDPPMVGPLLGMATPVLILTSLYLFWAGSHSPGGAFQAGALLGALGVLYRLTGRLDPLATTPLVLRGFLVVGLLVFSLVGVVALLWSPMPLSLPQGALYATVLLIEFALLLSIATTFALLFSATPGFRLHGRRPA